MYTFSHQIPPDDEDDPEDDLEDVPEPGDDDE